MSARLGRRDTQSGGSFGAFWVAVVCSDFADGEFRVVVPLMTLAVARSAFAVSAVGVAARLPWILVTLPAGVIVDRYRPVSVMRWASAVRLPLVACTVLLAAVGALPVVDEALRPVGLTSGQFSLLMSLNRPEPPRIGSVATLLAMDRTTLTANLKPLERRGLLRVVVDAEDRRSRRLRLTPAGRATLGAAVPVWRRTHVEMGKLLERSDPDRLRADLRALS